MQPYFLPYAGYFRLFAAADEVVLLDTVQFPREGYVHRNRFRTAAGDLAWLTLPLAYRPLETQIRHIAFADEADRRLEAGLSAFPAFAERGVADAAVRRELRRLGADPMDLIVA